MSYSRSFSKTVTIFVILTESNTEIVLVSFPDRVVLAFVLGFLVQEVVAVSREGFHVYKSKWWNVVDSLIILAFVVSYVTWYSGNKWNPENVTFVVADVIFSSAIVMSFFHLTHIFQVGDQLIVRVFFSMFLLNNKYNGLVCTRCAPASFPIASSRRRLLTCIFCL